MYINYIFLKVIYNLLIIHIFYYSITCSYYLSHLYRYFKVEYFTLRSNYYIYKTTSKGKFARFPT